VIELVDRRSLGMSAKASLSLDEKKDMLRVF
jgi:hypothetical protein